MPFSSSSGGGGGEDLSLPKNSRIVQPSYLDKHTSKKDLLRRLRTLVEVLRYSGEDSDDEDENDDNSSVDSRSDDEKEERKNEKKNKKKSNANNDDDDGGVVEANSPDWPGLDNLSTTLVATYLNHNDKDVRLYSLLCCIEIFGIYAPTVPWDDDELLSIFRNMIRQLANLAHTTDTTQTNFQHYAYILEQLACIKIGVVLVELVQQQQSNRTMDMLDDDDVDDDDDDGSLSDISESQNYRRKSKERRSKTPTNNRQRRNRSTSGSGLNAVDENESLEVLVDFIRTLLQLVRPEHDHNILEWVQQAITACLEQYDTAESNIMSTTSSGAYLIGASGRRSSALATSIPINILDELLQSIGQGPTMTVTNPALYHQQPSNKKGVASSQKKRSAGKKRRLHSDDDDDDDKTEAPTPLTIQQPNPTYMVAAAIIQKQLNRLATPVAALINALLNGDKAVAAQSRLVHAPSQQNANTAAGGDSSPQPPTTTTAAATAAANNNNKNKYSSEVYGVVYELHRVAPQILTTVIGTVSNGLGLADADARFAATQLLGQLFTGRDDDSNDNNKSSSGGATDGGGLVWAVQFRPCFREWLGRCRDVQVRIRKLMVKSCVKLLVHNEVYRDNNGMSTNSTIGNKKAGKGKNNKGGNGTGSMSFDERDVINQARQALVKLVVDPNLDVRMEAVHEICNAVYRSQSSGSVSSDRCAAVIDPALLQAVGGRVSSKHKVERRDALTGLSQIYWRKFMFPTVRPIERRAATTAPSKVGRDEGEDTFNLSAVLSILRSKCHLSTGGRHRNNNQQHHDIDDNANNMDDPDDELYGWIPTKVFESVYFTDQVDSEMRNRVVQIVDEIMLGSDLSSGSSKKLSPAARAVGLTITLKSLVDPEVYDDKKQLWLWNNKDSVHHHNGGSGSGSGSGVGGGRAASSSMMSNAFRYLQQLFAQKAQLQKTLSNYIDARGKIRECKPGSEEAMAADAKAVQLLAVVAGLTAPVSGSGTSTEDVMKQFHSARDKHIFRIMALITEPCHSTQARARALDELPKRTAALGDAVSTWTKNLVKRCAMGDFINEQVIRHCIILAQECLQEEDIRATAALLFPLKTAVDIFPELCGSQESFGRLTELFSECRMNKSSEVKKEIDDCGIITALSSILSATAPRARIEMSPQSDQELPMHLVQLCTRDGTPEQARNAVYTLARLVTPPASLDDPSSLSPMDTKDELSSLMESLTSPSRMKVTSADDESPHVVSILSALAALTECAPQSFMGSSLGERAIKFALEAVILGRTQAADGDSESGSDSDESDDSSASGRKGKKGPRRSKKGKTKKSKHSTPQSSGCLLEDENLSVACRRICAALELLVSYLRSSRLQQPPDSSRFASKEPADDRIRQIFKLLTQILDEQGVPPSDRDRKLCMSRLDRAALRQCSATSLLRLCDGRLGLEKKFLSASMWHSLGQALLDEEQVVREAVMDELCRFLQGIGSFGVGRSAISAKAPALRFVSLIALCTDGDHAAADGSNGNAASVGRACIAAKNAAFQCIVKLRKVSNATYAQCRSMGKVAEKKFETQLKMLLMPEYMVPYTFHLLSHRRETPCDDGRSDNPATNDDSQHRVLRKRLRALYEPLVQSLGDTADNISFLLRMAEMLGKNFVPVDVSPYATDSRFHESVTSNGHSVAFNGNFSTANKRTVTLHDKLKTISVAAREVLLSLVKKDVNLTPYPGAIQVPSFLFKRVTEKPKQPPKQPATKARPSSRDTVGNRKRSSQRPKTPSMGQGQSTNNDESARKSRVHFSPDAVLLASNRKDKFSPQSEKNHFGMISPIPKSTSPSAPSSSGRRGDGTSSDGGGDTLGTTPPSTLKDATMPSTATDGSNNDASQSSSMESPVEPDQSEAAAASTLKDAATLAAATDAAASTPKVPSTCTDGSTNDASPSSMESSVGPDSGAEFSTATGVTKAAYGRIEESPDATSGTSRTPDNQDAESTISSEEGGDTARQESEPETQGAGNKKRKAEVRTPDNEKICEGDDKNDGSQTSDPVSASIKVNRSKHREDTENGGNSNNRSRMRVNRGDVVMHASDLTLSQSKMQVRSYPAPPSGIVVSSQSGSKRSRSREGMNVSSSARDSALRLNRIDESEVQSHFGASSTSKKRAREESDVEDDDDYGDESSTQTFGSSRSIDRLSGRKTAAGSRRSVRARL